MDGIKIQIGNWLSLDTPTASLAFVGLGLFLLLTGLAGTVTIQAQETKLEVSDKYIETSTPVISAVPKIPPQGDVSGTQESLSLATSKNSYDNLQADAFASLDILAQDESLALTVLNSLSENTFGLAGIPRENAERFSELLAGVTQRFPDNVALRIQSADLYRSLYQTAEDEKYRTAWGKLAKDLAADSELEGLQKYQAHQLFALFLQSKEDYKNALAHLEEAKPTAPQKELYKLEYNLCNNYYLMGSPDQAQPHCERSRDLAAGQNLNTFWPPTFILATIEQGRGDYEATSDLFAQCLEMAQAKGETDLLLHYIKAQAELAELCKEPSFSGKFPSLCDVSTEGR